MPSYEVIVLISGWLCSPSTWPRRLFNHRCLVFLSMDTGEDYPDTLPLYDNMLQKVGGKKKKEALAFVGGERSGYVSCKQTRQESVDTWESH